MPVWPVRLDLRLDLEDPELFRLITRAEAMAGTIRGIPLPPVVWDEINRLNIARAVRGTTGIEGSRLDESEVARILSGPPDSHVLPPDRDRDEAEVRNAAAVTRFIEETLDADGDRPLTEDLIREIHMVTTSGIRYEHNVPGQYRSHAANAGDYVPPRGAAEVERLMTELVAWLHSGPVANWHAVIRAIAAHFYFVSIHPFGDGNGRTARAIESFLLYQGNINPVGFYSLANFYYVNRSRYIEMLDSTRFDSGNDLTPFIKWAAAGLVDEMEQVHARVVDQATLVAFRDFARERVAARTSLPPASQHRVLALVYRLGSESVPLQDVRAGRHPAGYAHASVTPRTLSRDLKLLEDLELVVRSGGAVRANLEIMRRFRSGRPRGSS